jgi:hypothetical protein
MAKAQTTEADGTKKPQALLVDDSLTAFYPTTEADGTKKPRYPAVKDNQMTNDKQRPDWPGFLISASVLVFLAVLWLIVGCFGPNSVFPILTFLLLGYRWAKEVRTSWRSLQPA